MFINNTNILDITTKDTYFSLSIKICLSQITVNKRNDQTTAILPESVNLMTRWRNIFAWLLLVIWLFSCSGFAQTENTRTRFMCRTTGLMKNEGNLKYIPTTNLLINKNVFRFFLLLEQNIMENKNKLKRLVIHVVLVK